MKTINEELLTFLQQSPAPFQAICTVSRALQEAGFTPVKESTPWKLQAGGAYYVTRNGSSIIAFTLPKGLTSAAKIPYHFQMAASHSDSPTYKLKALPELQGPGSYLRLNTEAYGGMIDYTWLDKPLSVAGRVLVREGDTIVSRLFAPDRDLLLIPSVAIHFNREVNKGYAFNRQIDLCPLASAGALKQGAWNAFVAAELGVAEEDIAAQDLYLVNRQAGTVWGVEREFVSAPKLDDLQAAFASLKGFLAAHQEPQKTADGEETIRVYCCFDNEEVGSGTKQGALSTFLEDVLVRINSQLGGTDETYRTAVAKSFMVSFDNAHAVHPNHPELTDSENHCVLNGGPVIKENASQKYTTDAVSRAVFREICKKAQVPVQTFANRSNMPGGSTLGNLSTMHVSVHTVDIGLAQLAMHSSYETAGALDTAYAVRALTAYYTSAVLVDGAESVTVR